MLSCDTDAGCIPDDVSADSTEERATQRFEKIRVAKGRLPEKAHSSPRGSLRSSKTGSGSFWRYSLGGDL